MSRRRGEFEHRTSIFEGAYRAWSHLGGLDPTILTSTTAADLDPLSHPHTADIRVKCDEETNSFVVVDSTGIKRLYPYEPLPRTGLAHPFVQAIISPWLGPDAEQDDIQLGLTTLRTWWQHRRKGESTSAKQALGTDKMRSVVEGYTRHFFNLAHCMVMNDGEQPPRTLATKVKEMEKNGMKLEIMRKKEAAAVKKLIPLRRETEDIEGGDSCCGGGGGQSQNNAASTMESENEKGNESNQGKPRAAKKHKMMPPMTPKVYGDPNRTPVVFLSPDKNSGNDNDSIQIAMSITGITCDHCVKIIETVLKGVGDSQSPIHGLIDAAADRELESVLIRIAKSSFAKRIAFEAKENLKLVGYDATAKEISIIDPTSGATLDLSALSTAFDVVAATDARDVFDWSLKCTCPDNGIVRQDCPRHSQMNKRIFEAFDEREKQVREFMAGCGRKYGMACSCGTKCKCSSGKCCAAKSTAGTNAVQNDKNMKSISDTKKPATNASTPNSSNAGTNSQSQRMQKQTPNVVQSQHGPLPMNTPMVNHLPGQPPFNMNDPSMQFVPPVLNGQRMLVGQHGAANQFQAAIMHHNSMMAMQQAAMQGQNPLFLQQHTAMAAFQQQQQQQQQQANWDGKKKNGGDRFGWSG